MTEKDDHRDDETVTGDSDSRDALEPNWYRVMAAQARQRATEAEHEKDADEAAARVRSAANYPS